MTRPKCICGHTQDKHTSIGCIHSEGRGKNFKVCDCHREYIYRGWPQIWKEVGGPIKKGDPIKVEMVNDKLTATKIEFNSVCRCKHLYAEHGVEGCNDTSCDCLSFKLAEMINRSEPLGRIVSPNANIPLDDPECKYQDQSGPNSHHFGTVRKTSLEDVYSDEQLLRYGIKKEPEISFERHVEQNRPFAEVYGGPERRRFERIATEAGKMVEEKNEAYGDAFAKAGEILKVLYPNGIKVEQYTDALATVRILDKLFRIATRKDAFGESPYKDIIGYGILGAAKDEKK